MGDVHQPNPPGQTHKLWVALFPVVTPSKRPTAVSGTLGPSNAVILGLSGVPAQVALCRGGRPDPGACSRASPIWEGAGI